MAAFFPSFLASGIPRRLLRYALSKIDLLEEETLNMDNLDVSLGRTSTAEFKDVGIVIKKLEKLLKLPPTFRVQRAKVLQLRVTIPVDIYSSPITVDIEGVDVRLKVLGSDEKAPGRPSRDGSRTPDDGADVVPDPAQLAQSFLETQPSAERRRMEEALAADAQDMSASVSMASDDGSEDELAFGTGQPLSLPAFLADFIQGIVDRVQIRIGGVTFQLDVEVPVDTNSAATELVTFQIALDGINVEGVTTLTEADEEAGTALVPKEGKRHISLANVRAYLISEANVFSALARSPSMSSPAVSQTPSVVERNPPSRQSSIMTQSLRDSYLSDPGDPFEADYPLQDSEDAFNIPYDFGQPDEADEDSPATPRASIYQDFLHAPNVHGSHSHHIAEDDFQWGTSERESRSEPSLRPAPGMSSETLPGPIVQTVETQDVGVQVSRTPEASQHSEPLSDNSDHSGGEEDLTKSHVYTHEEAESMYMSAFSEQSQSQLQSQSESVRPSMPGAWDDSPESSPRALRAVERSTPSPPPVVVDTKQPLDFEPEEDVPPKLLEQPVADDRPSTPPPVVQGSDSVADVAVETVPVPMSPTQPDDVPTPRGPTRLVKEILSLGQISIYLPSMHKHLQVHTDDPASVAHLKGTTASLAKSVHPQLPGAFSVYSTAGGASTYKSPPSGPEAVESQTDGSLEIILSPLEIRFDMSLGFLLAMVVSKLLEAVKPATEAPSKPADTASSGGTASSTRPPFPDIKFTAQEIRLHFLHHLGGQADTAQRYLDPTSFHFQQEVLLRAVMENLTARHQWSENEIITNVNLERFRFGYANDDIISFDRSTQMEMSIREGFRPVGMDVSIKSITSPGRPERSHIEVETLPLYIAMDLQRLDDTFSWFGGLSSFLSMGSSMTSSTSPSLKSVAPVKPKPRGVRFETPIDPNDKSLESANKMSVRVGGFGLQLIGKECTVGLESSAIKIVNREAGVGIAITKIRLAGPYLRNSGAKPPITAEVRGCRFEFLNAPKDVDLDKLLQLVVPSNVKFDEDKDEIMVDALLRQRTRGPVLRVTTEKVQVDVGRISQLACLPQLGEEIARLATVAKYLPEDDRPGLLTLANIKSFGATVDIGGRLGTFSTTVNDIDAAHISIPSLLALAVGQISLTRNQREELVGSFMTSPASTSDSSAPVVLRARMIGDVIEPIINIRLQDLYFEYRVPTVMDILGLAEDATPQDFEASLAASVANLGDQAHVALGGKPLQPARTPGHTASTDTKPMTVDLRFGDCLIGLNPLGLTAKLVVALTDAHLAVTVPKNIDTKADLQINKACVLLVDDVSQVTKKEAPNPLRRRTAEAASQQVNELCSRGFVNVSYISSTKISVEVLAGEAEGDRHVDVDFRDAFMVLETCADSTQTLIALSNALKPPTPPSKEPKYRTKVVPMQDMLASISAEAFGKAEGMYDFDDDFAIAQELGGDDLDETASDDSPLEVHSQFYDDRPAAEELFDATSSSLLSDLPNTQQREDALMLAEFGSASGNASSDDGELVVHENYFGVSASDSGTAKVWNSSRNSYDRAPAPLVKKSPLKVTVRDVHVIWNLFDGYDWARTRDVITQAVQEVERKAFERRSRQERLLQYEDEDEGEEAIGDFLFNSIYIGIPANRDPASLAAAINQELNDAATETESVATTAFTATTSRAGGRRPSQSKKLKLKRSRHHKITFELQGVDVDLIAFPPDSGETLNSIDVRVQNLNIFDHVPTSTWKKFATYDQDAGEREMGKSMVHLELLTVQPMPDLQASELVVRATLMPLRLHVDQDALDFITRFFEFKDDSVPVHSSPSDVPFLQRVEVNDVPVKLDFKPKRVDYAGLRSGHTTEFMNFIVLDEARMVLRHVIIYGVTGFDRMGKMLNDVWMPDIKRNQLPGILAGLAPVRSIVNVGSGFKNLIEIPIREYRKDGRIVRSISKGAAAFAKTTGTELVKLGAKVAIGTQYVLQGAEVMLTKPGQQPGAVGEGLAAGWEEDDEVDPAEERKQISLYADQPTGVIQGLRGGYASLTRDLNMARDAIIAVPGEVMESQGASGAAAAVLRRAPTIIFRPAIGATKVIGQTLMGATNSLDPENRRRVEEKYKKH